MTGLVVRYNSLARGTMGRDETCASNNAVSSRVLDGAEACKLGVSWIMAFWAESMSPLARLLFSAIR